MQSFEVEKGEDVMKRAGRICGSGQKIKNSARLSTPGTSTTILQRQHANANTDRNGHEVKADGLQDLLGSPRPSFPSVS